MSEATDRQEPEQQKTEMRKLSSKLKHRRFAKPGELILGIVCIVIGAALLAALINELTFKRDVANARIVSDRVIADIKKRDGADIRSIGSPSFQQNYTGAELTQGFKNVEIATLGSPSLDRQIALSTSSGRIIFFVYKYSTLKVPFYVSTSIQEQSGHWYLVNIDGNVNESQLTGGS